MNHRVSVQPLATPTAKIFGLASLLVSEMDPRLQHLTHRDRHKALQGLGLMSAAPANSDPLQGTLSRQAGNLSTAKTVGQPEILA